MKRTQTGALLLPLGMIVASCWAAPVKDAPALAFDKAAYEARVKKAFENDVIGYESVLIKNGQVVAQNAGGMARNAADGNVKMSTSMPANIGSTIKFTGGVTLLALFESKDKTINPKGLTVDQWLDSPIYPFLPAVWQKGTHDSIKRMSFRQLLQHKSGFRKLSAEDKGPDGDKRMFDYLAKGVLAADVGVRDYENANFSLVTYLIPMIAKPALIAQVDADATKNKWSAEGAEVHQRIADEWEKLMHAQIYGKITPVIHPSCNPTVEYVKAGKSWAPDYASKSDLKAGATRDSRATNGYCQAQGGWYITARELAAFVANFAATDTLVSGITRDKMYDDDKANDRLVWSFTIGDKAIDNKFHYSQLAYMGGDHGGAHATILMLPNGYYAVGIINSDDINSYGVTARLLRGFKTGLGMPEDPGCPKLGTDIAAAEKNILAKEAALAAMRAPGGNKDAIPITEAFLAAAKKTLKDLEAKAEKAVCSL
ncbi:MAG: serine hydrolase domain-containing protein [Pseudomonadota bacterium]